MRPDLGRGPAMPTTGRIPMSEFTVTRTLKAPRARVWQVLTQAGHFEGWLPAKSGTGVLDVRTGWDRGARVLFSARDGIAMTGRLHHVCQAYRPSMTLL